MRQHPESPSPSVGMPARLEQVVLPAPAVEVRAVDDATPLILRIVSVDPHGTALRYDFEYYGLEPGSYDLREFLERPDGGGVDDLPALPVTIASVLPPGQIEPHALAATRIPILGGYRVALILIAAAWCAGLWLLWRHRRRTRRRAQQVVAAQPTLADRLRPLVEAARAGRLTTRGRADLEMTLLAYWREALHLEDRAALEVARAVKEHREAGPLFAALEQWLHAPQPASGADVQALLQPYEKVQAPPPAAAAAPRSDVA